MSGKFLNKLGISVQSTQLANIQKCCFHVNVCLKIKQK